jgi:hypothetical protein
MKLLLLKILGHLIFFFSSFLIDVFLPCPDNLLVNLAERQELVRYLLGQLPTKFLNSYDTNSSLGPALQAAYKLMVSYRFPFSYVCVHTHTLY